MPLPGGQVADVAEGDAWVAVLRAAQIFICCLRIDSFLVLLLFVRGKLIFNLEYQITACVAQFLQRV